MDVFKYIPNLLGRGESFVLAAIVSRSGSAPRAVGTRMVVRGDGSIIGTIGGGILEAQVQDLSREVFSERNAVLKKFVLTAEDAGRMGMICGGQVHVLVHFVDALNTAQVQLYREILAVIKSRKRALLITELPSGTNGREVPLQHLSGCCGTLAGHMDDETVRALTAQFGVGKPELVVHGENRYLVEWLCHEGSVYIFGAGHISQKLAPLTGLVGFATFVLDDREEFANRERFETADEVIVLNSFDSALDGLEINEDSYLVLVTRGHAHDKTVLGKALRTEAGYIGMIGSRRKRDAMYEALCREGFSRHEFVRVHSPVGLDIGAETPEEIAVSVVAELIQVRAGRRQ
jgi:xanthine dehydrogenase accessory factor